MDNYQIFPISEIANRLATSDDRTKSVRLYSGHITGSGTRPVLAFQIARNPVNNEWPQDRVQYLNTFKGKFTVQFLPSRETFFVESENNFGGQYSVPFFSEDAMPMNGYGSGYNNEAVARILELEKQVTALTMERDQLREELSEFETNGGKLAFAFGKLMDDFLLPKLMSNAKQQPMQGTQQKNWQQIDINEDVATALMVVHNALGDDLLLDTAYYLQSNPQMVQQLRLLIPQQ